MESELYSTRRSSRTTSKKSNQIFFASMRLRSTSKPFRKSQSNSQGITATGISANAQQAIQVLLYFRSIFLYQSPKISPRNSTPRKGELSLSSLKSFTLSPLTFPMQAKNSTGYNTELETMTSASRPIATNSKTKRPLLSVVIWMFATKK